MVRHALVAGECRWQADFLQHNRSLVAEVESLEHRSRRRDVLVDEDTLTAFYDERIPAEIGDLAGLRAWLKKDQEAGKRLCFDRDWLMRHAAGAVTAERYPPTLDLAGQSLPLHYHFEPGSEDDGVTVDVPLAVLNQLELGRVERLVPGLLEAKLAACIRSLPKSWRRLYVPADEFALAALAAVQASDAPLLEQLADELGRMTGRRPPATEFRPDRVEPHFFMRVRVFDSEGRELAASRDLEKLRAKLSAQATRAFDHLISPVERDAITRWDFGELPETVDVLRDGHRLSGYPALVDDGQSVSLRVFDDAERARLTSISGLRRLFALALGRDLRWLRRNLPGIETSCLHYAPIGACEELSEDILDRVLDEVFAIRDGGICSDKEFESRLAAGRSGLVSVGNRIAELCGRILDAFSRARRALAEVNDVEIADQLRGHLEGMVYPGFVRETPPEWIIHLPRYLEGARIRAQTAAQDPGRDRQRAAQVEPLWRRCREALAASATDPELLRYRWMLEEFRVSLFAQQLRASIPISEKRLEKQWAKVGR
jgi:ATP-dependent helicase HrpA